MLLYLSFVLADIDGNRFATGWNYFFKYVIVLPNNLTVTGIIISYWRPDLNVSIWIVVFGVAIIALNVRKLGIFPPCVS